jgi:hypothetical protein
LNPKLRSADPLTAEPAGGAAGATDAPEWFFIKCEEELLWGSAALRFSCAPEDSEATVAARAATLASKAVAGAKPTGQSFRRAVMVMDHAQYSKTVDAMGPWVAQAAASAVVMAKE